MTNPTTVSIKDGNGASQTVSTLDALVGPIAPVCSSALASSLVLNAAACSLFGFQVNTTTAAGWVMLFDATSAPVDGAVTPKKWWQIGPNSTLGIDSLPPLSMLTGAVLVFSTTGPFTKTASATAAFSGETR
jgi:hypothetical protein